MQEAEGAVPPSPPLRRGRSRVREISSRFMSPLVQVAPTPKPAASEPPRSKSVEKRQRQEVEVDVACRNFIETAKSLDSTTTNATPFHHIQNHKSVPLKKPQQQQRGKPPCPVDKENDVRSEAKSELQHLPRSNSCSNSRAISRPDTPISSIPTTTAANRDKIVASRYRQTLHPRQAPSATSTPAAKLLIDATKSSDVAVPPQAQAHETSSLLVQDKISKSIIDRNHLCTTTSIGGTPHPQGNRLRRSMSEVEHVLPNNRASPHSRSLSNSQNSSSWISLKGTDCDASTVTSSSTPNKTSSPVARNNQTGNCYQLPPHPENKARLGAPDAMKKPRKLLFNQQDDVHSFKLLYNHYLQWRFANARADVSMLSQKKEAERQLYALGIKISDMRDSVMKKRLELQMLQRLHTSSSIAESQMPYLDEWSAMEEDYSSSLLGVIEALQNLSLRLPVSGGVKVNVTELGEILESAEKLSESIVSNIESYRSKAEEVESLTCELARVTSAETAQLHDCGDSLLGVYASQVEECSLRGHIIQFCGHKNNSQSQQ
ncbi:OLC1v1020062C2 [Oldenlandia corymbosa var. corymbosa]|nr:OLC1v1020062C2 [Oldenlandia corymbosa var. corymbosa]